MVREQVYIYKRYFDKKVLTKKRMFNKFGRPLIVRQWTDRVAHRAYYTVEDEWTRIELKEGVVNL